MASPKHIRGRSAAYLVLLISLISTLVVYHRVKHNVAARHQVRFQQGVNTTESAMRERMRQYLDVLKGVRGLFAASEQVEAKEWEEYLSSLELSQVYPGIHSIGYAPKVTPAEKAAHIDRSRKEIHPSYQILPEGDRPEYFPLTFFSQFDQGEPEQLGSDIFTDPQHRSVLERARKTGLPSLTGKVDLFPARTNKPQSGFLLYLPVYQKGQLKGTEEELYPSLQGFILARFVPRRFFQGIVPSPISAHVRLEVYEGVDSSPARLLYDDDSVQDAGKPSGSFLSTKRALQVLRQLPPGKDPVPPPFWTLHFKALPSFQTPLDRYLPMLALGAGLLISFLLFGISLWEVGAREAAEKLSAQRHRSEESLQQANAALQEKILEHQKTEATLAHEQSLLRALLDNIPDRVYFKDRDSRILKCSKEVVKHLKLNTPDEAVGKNDFDFFEEPHAQAAFEDEKRIMETGHPLIGKIENEKWKNGDTTWVLTTKMPLRDKEGKIIGTFGTSKDITSLKESEDALAAEKERLAVTLRSIGEGVITTDISGIVTLINSSAETLTGWPNQEAIGKSLSEVLRVVDTQSRQPPANPVKAIVLDGERTWHSEEGILLSRNGNKRYISQTCAGIDNHQGEVIGVVVVFRDISEQQRTEAERLRASKLESVGVLAGGIAHDFNNILTAIIGNLSLAKMCVHSTEKMMARVSDAERAALRAKDLTQQLLTFSKGGAPIKKTVSVAPIIKEATLFALRGSNINSEFSLPNDLWPVEVDEGQMTQVINHLILNARDAMKEGGKLEVRAENVELVGHRTASLSPGSYVKISVRDYGVGIAPENLSKIFDPYFTTKEEASGLGLATAYSIVRKHGGQISLESTLGQGTVFYLYLQAARHKEVAALTPEAEQIRFFGEGKILLMDDEEEIRMVAQAMLEILGYEVVVVKDGAEAIEHYMRAKAAGKPFAAVIMDLTVPNGMGGKETIRRLRDLDANVRAVVSSGYSYDPVMANFRDFGFCGVMPKPYKIQDMGRLLQEILGIHPGTTNEPVAPVGS